MQNIREMNKILHKIINVEVKESILVCYFNDDTVVEYDMKKTLADTGTMIEPLRDKKFFSKVFIESGALAWPNGYDICPE